MKGDAVPFVKLANEDANLSSHYALERLPIGSDYIYMNSTGAQRCGNLQTDKTGANNQDAFCRSRPGNDRLTVSERAQIMKLSVGRAFYRQSDRIGSRG
jgi:hypothetical protein